MLITSRNVALRQGLDTLLGGPNSFVDVLKIKDGSAHLKKHPLDLSIPALPRQYPKDPGLWLIAAPAFTKESVNAMTTIMAYVSKQYTVAKELTYLRTILTAEEDGQDVYFEAGTFNGAFICGGDADFSDECISDKESLDALFALVSEIFEIPVEVVQVHAPRSAEFRKTLAKAWNEREQDAA